MTNSLDSDQARRIVGPDLGPNCLPRLSADDTGRQRVKAMFRRAKFSLPKLQAFESVRAMIQNEYHRLSLVVRKPVFGVSDQV